MPRRRRSIPYVRWTGAVYRFEKRDRRVRGGKLSISLQTDDPSVAAVRAAAILTLLERGDAATIERLRRRQLHIADVAAAVREGDFERLKRPAAEPLTLGAVLDRALQRIEATLAEGTVRNYRTVRRQLLQRFGPDREIATITRDELEEWLHEPKPRGKDRTPKPWSPGRQAVMRAMAGAIFREAVEREKEIAERLGASPRISRNPFDGVALPRVRATRFEFLRPEEWIALRSVVEGTPRAAFLALGCLAGLRMGEAAYLRPGIDVDMERRLILVQPREGEHPWRPKTDRSIRRVPIGRELYEILERHFALGFAGSRYLIRLPGKDRPVSHATLQDWTRMSFEASGIKYGRRADALTYHSLRHTFASWLIQRNWNLKIVADLLGDTVEMVVHVYGHLIPENYEAAVADLDAMLGEVRGKTGSKSHDSSHG